MTTFAVIENGVLTFSKGFVLGRMSNELKDISIRLIGTDKQNAIHSPNDGGQTTPHMLFAQPIKSVLGESSVVVGYLLGVVALESYLSHLLPESVSGVTAVLENTCGDLHTFRLDEEQAVYVGRGDKDSFDFRNKADTFTVPETESPPEGACSYSISISPTQHFEDNYHDSDKILFYTILVVVIFAVTAFAFFIYDFIVQRRNSLVLQTAAKFNTIVSSLFPSNIRGRLFADKEKDYMEYTTAKSHLKNFLTKGDIDMNEGDEEDDGDGLILRTKPMADLFTDTTIMFADIAGFTAWSSVREPSQVFILLETVYRSFDQ